MKVCEKCGVKMTPFSKHCNNCGSSVERVRAEVYVLASDKTASETPVPKTARGHRSLPQWLIAIAFVVSLVPVIPVTWQIMKLIYHLDQWGITKTLWGAFLLEVFSFICALVIYGLLFKLWCDIILPAIRSRFGD